MSVWRRIGTVYEVMVVKQCATLVVECDGEERFGKRERPKGAQRATR